MGLLLKKWTLVLLAVLKPLGFWGAGAIAILDSSTIPVPMDLLLATYMWNDRAHAWVYVLMGAAGSAIGGLLPFLLGRAGGELFLLKRINRARYEALRNRFERQEFLALLVPSMLPPPTPWKLFVFAAGVFEMRVLPFMLAVFLGRLLRFSVLAILTVKYGPTAVGELGHLAHDHAHVLLSVLGLLLVGIAVYMLRQSNLRKGVARAERDGEFEN
ncbi:YqaA family protein [Acidipila sp. EB88]|uniref:YqaA family protein n=1 Tax=Acidipila sp. EB88 TaxID=2305226 RepID=UPI001F35A6B1|nr:VTT domain-containing protein [Acidipila sp. EB88]